MTNTNQRSLWITGAGVVALVLVILAAMGFYMPETSRAAEARSSTESAREANDVLRRRLAELEADFARLDEFNAELAGLRGQFPTSLELSNFTRYLSDLAEAAGLTVQSIQVASPLPVDSLPELPPAPDGTEAAAMPEVPEGLYMYPITLAIKGSLDSARSYIAALQAETLSTRMFLAPQMTWSQEVEIDDTGTLGELFNISGMTFALLPTDQIPREESESGEESEASDESTEDSDTEAEAE
ncbi:MAG: hypothetical protein LBH48_03970 [Bifidobacteriaceae bacterium]|jgi:hypothetical protein|nr:hypothetical protein [Bifidobacteriaceae bacterium]